MSEQLKVFLAVDLGASSGRVMAGEWDGKQLKLEELHRFPTPSVKLGRYWHWDVLSLYREIVEGLRKAGQRYTGHLLSVSVDTWGVDYALLDENGELLANPICYRDDRTDGMIEEFEKSLGRELIYEETGIQFMFFNSLYQFAAEKRDQRPAYLAAKRALFLPDLINYWLSGEMATERSVASTSQMLNPKTGDWSQPLLESVGLKKEFLGSIVESGTRLGSLRSEIQELVGEGELSVVATLGHDTGAAFAAIPGNEQNFAVLNSGTWSIMGLELKDANCSKEALSAGFSNEIGYGGSIRFLTNICGMWLLEESLRHWKREGEEFGYADLAQLAREAEPMRSLFDPDDPIFAKPGDMPGRIVEYCLQTDQPAPSSPGEVARSIFDSLALKYRYVFKKIEQFSSEPLKGMHVLGGGSRNKLLNQMTADAIGLPVLAGPAEATAIGNIVTQLIASEDVSSLAAGRELIANSFPLDRFEPQESTIYLEAADRFERLVAGSEVSA